MTMFKYLCGWCQNTHTYCDDDDDFWSNTTGNGQQITEGVL